MKILMVHSGADLYGASRCLLRLAARLHRDGHDVCVVLPYDGPIQSELKRAGVTVFIHGDLPILTRSAVRSPWNILSLLLNIPISALHLARLMRRFAPDLVLSNTATVLLSPGLAARFVRIPHVWHIREFFEEFPRFWSLYRHMISALADRIICVSAAVAGQFAGTSATNKVVAIHDGFPADEFKPVAPREAATFRRRFALEDVVVFAVIGRIKMVRKGQETFVKAAALLKEKHSNARFMLVGSPFEGNEAHLERIQAMIRDLGLAERFVLTGDLQDTRPVYEVADVIVLPSGLPEPFAGTVVEAMAFSKPVVGTHHGGTVEQIEDGVTGYLVPPNDPAAMADAFDRLLQDKALRVAMGRAGRARFESLFEFEPHYRKILALYEQVIRP